jgi:hypothetical protein
VELSAVRLDLKGGEDSDKQISPASRFDPETDTAGGVRIASVATRESTSLFSKNLEQSRRAYAADDPSNVGSTGRKRYGFAEQIRGRWIIGYRGCGWEMEM